MEINSVALIGLGAMGVFFAPRLEAYLGKDKFNVIAEGLRKERLETLGVTINGTKYLFPIVEPKEGTPKDLVIIAVKDSGLKEAIQHIEKFVGPKTQIMCVMNGVNSEEEVIKVYGKEHTIYSYMRMSIVMKDGIANFDPYWGKVHFGEIENTILSSRVQAIKKLMENADIPYQIDKNMMQGMWFKFMCNIGENMTCGLLGIPFGGFQAIEEANIIRVAAMKEVQKIAYKKGIEISDELLENQYQTILKIPAENKPSTLQDIEAGKKTEVEMFAGEVVRMGEELGIETPVNWMFYFGIKVLEAKAENNEKF